LTVRQAAGDVQQRTIADFGEQWSRYPDADGFFGSAQLFNDIFSPFLSTADIKAKRVAEIGAGAGRYIRILADAGASEIVAVEPSAAYDVLRATTRDVADRVTYLHVRGDSLPPLGRLDYVFAIGVLHHIPEPDPVVRAAQQALKPGGMFAAWLYGLEGNGAYLALFNPLWWLARRLPHQALAALTWILYPPLWLYMNASRVLPLPLAAYMRDVIRPLTPAKRRLVIYDQLNPAYAKYYTRAEALDLFRRGGFVDVRIHHRLGYSWTVVGRRPEAA
jgi:SAM-dependent methyltransferase